MKPQEVKPGTVVLASCNAPWSSWRRCGKDEPSPWQIWDDVEEAWTGTDAWPLLVLPYPSQEVQLHLPTHLRETTGKSTDKGPDNDRLRFFCGRPVNVKYLKSVLGQRLVGRQVVTEAIGFWPGGLAEVIDIEPDPEAPDIVFRVRSSVYGEVGIFEGETVELVPQTVRDPLPKPKQRRYGGVKIAEIE